MFLAQRVMTVVWVVGLAVSAAGLAAEQSATESQARAAPTKDVDPPVIDDLVGRWQVEATDPATGRTEKIRYDVRPFVGQAWLSGTGRSEDPDFESKDVWGHDPITKEVIRVIFLGSGTYAMVRSPGWRNRTLVLEGDARSADGVMRVRETITWVGRDEFRATWEAQRDGTWHAYSIEKVTRLPPD